MESIKSTISNFAGYGDKSPDTTGHSTTTGTTDTTGATGSHGSTGVTSGTESTGVAGSTSTDNTSTIHDITTIGGNDHSSKTTATPSHTTGGDTSASSGGIIREDKPSNIDLSNTHDDSSNKHQHEHQHEHEHKHHDPTEIQSPSQGPDPALVGEPQGHAKLTGQGVPGSHSAVFGLTPDGKRHEDTTHGTGPLGPAHSAETTMGKKSVSAPSGGIKGGEGGVSNQIDAPDMGKKGLARKDPVPEGLSSGDGKPGAGSTAA